MNLSQLYRLASTLSLVGFATTSIFIFIFLAIILIIENETIR